MSEKKKLSEYVLEKISGGGGYCYDLDYIAHTKQKVCDMHENCGGILVDVQCNEWTVSRGAFECVDIACNKCGMVRRSMDEFEYVSIYLQANPLTFYLCHNRGGGIEETRTCPPALVPYYQNIYAKIQKVLKT